MKKNIDILVVESDTEQVEEIKRFLKPGTESFQFVLQPIATLDEVYTLREDDHFGAILLNAEFLKERMDLERFSRFMQELHIPIIILSKVLDADTKQKALKINASDFVLNNKLNLFHLPKTLESALRLNQNTQAIESIPNYSLYDHLPQAVIVFSGEKVIYFNKKALHLLKDDTLSKLRKYTSLSIKVFDLHLKGTPYTIHKTDRDNHQILFINSISEESSDMLVGISKIVEYAPFLIFKDDHLIFFNEKAHQTLIDVELYSTFEQLFTLDIEHTPSRIIHRGSQSVFAFNIENTNIAGKEYQLVMLGETLKSKQTTELPLRKFISAFSHDLKEPVRTSLNYIQLLERKANKDEAEYVSILSTEMKRMDGLLQNMKMALSADEEPLQRSSVNIRKVLESVFKQLKTEIDVADAMIDLGQMPEIEADQVKLHVVFTQLIENSLKFRKQNKRCFIEILAEQKPNETIFCIKDNGIGIDPKYHEDIFQAFQRLVSFENNPSNGLGLYICKTIIEQHNGKIWVESREGFGTSAFFTIPR